MEKIIDPVDRNLLKEELNPGRFIRRTNNGDNEIFIVNFNNAPNVLKEIGRLREITFRNAGGGTGKSMDLDEYDLGLTRYDQLIVWNPAENEITGGYRFIKCCEAAKDKDGNLLLATSELFNFTKRFIQNYLDNTIELGRSFVQPKYQPVNDIRKGLFSLDNLWDGLGAIVIDNPDIKYFFGKVTMYSDFNPEARDMILSFMHWYFPDKENLVIPIIPLNYKTDVSSFDKIFEGLPYKDGHKILNQFVRGKGENIPPLFNSYMNLSSTMKTFGTALNEHFGGVEETGILVSIDDIFDSKKERHITSYSSKK